MIQLIGTTSPLAWGELVDGGRIVPVLENPAGIQLCGNRAMWTADTLHESILPACTREFEMVPVPESVFAKADDAAHALGGAATVPADWPSEPFPTAWPPGVQATPRVGAGGGDFAADLRVAKAAEEALREPVLLVVNSVVSGGIIGQTEELLLISGVPNILFSDGLYDGLTANMGILRRETDDLVSAIGAATSGDDAPLASLQRSKRIDKHLRRLWDYLGGNFGLAYALQRERPLEYAGQSRVLRHLPTGQLLLVHQIQPQDGKRYR